MADSTVIVPEPIEPAGALPVASRGRLATFDVLQIRAYRIIWIGTILAFTGFNISNTAQGVLAFDLTGNNGAVGLVQFGQGLAMVLLNPLTGALVDRFPKRMLIVTAQSIIGISMFAVAILILTDQITILFLAMSSFIVGCAFAFNGPTRTALLGELVDDARLGRAMALVQVGGNFARITGPFLAGVLLSISFIHTGGTYLIVAILMGFVSLTMYQIPQVKGSSEMNKTGLLDDIREGIGYIRHQPRLVHTLATFHVTTILGFSYLVLMPGFAKETLDAGNAGLGVLLGSAAIGGLLFSLIVVTMADSPRVPHIVTGAGLLLGSALIVLGAAPTFLLAVVTMVFLGAGSSVFQTLNNVLAARYSDSHHLGRVMALIFMAFGFNSLVGLPIGFLADAIGNRAVFMGMGGTLCAATVLLAIWYRRIVADERAASTA